MPNLRNTIKRQINCHSQMPADTFQSTWNKGIFMVSIWAHNNITQLHWFARNFPATLFISLTDITWFALSQCVSNIQFVYVVKRELVRFSKFACDLNILFVYIVYGLFLKFTLVYVIFGKAFKQHTRSPMPSFFHILLPENIFTKIGYF